MDSSLCSFRQGFNYCSKEICVYYFQIVKCCIIDVPFVEKALIQWRANMPKPKFIVTTIFFYPYYPRPHQNKTLVDEFNSDKNDNPPTLSAHTYEHESAIGCKWRHTEWYSSHFQNIKVCCIFCSQSETKLIFDIFCMILFCFPMKRSI